MQEKSERSRTQLLKILAGFAGATALALNGEELRKSGRLLYNDRVRVSRIWKRAQEVTPMHDVAPSILAFLTDSSVKLTHPDRTNEGRTLPGWGHQVDARGKSGGRNPQRPPGGDHHGGAEGVKEVK